MSALRSRLRGSDLLRLSAIGLRARPARTALSALGVAIGIAAMVAVVGTSASSHERLERTLAALGTNLLTARVATRTLDEPPPLPVDVSARVARIPGVHSTAGVGVLDGRSVYRNALVPVAENGGITVAAAEVGLPRVVRARLGAGVWLDAGTSRLPVAVLGSTAAKRLGVDRPGQRIWLAGGTSTVVGILRPVRLAPELDSAALVGVPMAVAHYGYDRHPTRVYERSSDRRVPGVRDVLAASIQPERPSAVEVSRPSDALAAANAANSAFTGLLLALGSIALAVSGIGVANTMIIGVLERRQEIGLRRAMGATRGHIRAQFLCEALLLSALGGVLGSVIGAVVTFGMAIASGWVPVLPPLVLVGGVAATVGIGAVAGLYPAMRAARTPPTVALASP